MIQVSSIKTKSNSYVINKANIMKTTSKVLALVGILSASSQGATTISGTIGSAFKDNTLSTNIANGSLVMLIADAGTAGFLTTSSTGVIVASTTALAGPTTIPTAGALTVGSLFGGDTIMAVGTAGNSGSISGFSNFTPITSKNFALVWFTQAAAQVGAGSYFGMMSLSDWLMPSDADGKTYTVSATDASNATSFYSSSTATTATQLGSTGFITGSGAAVASPASSNIVKGATFQIIPEPSAALLGAIGALGLLRRRRN
jgi:hypothetical protein